MFIKYIIEFILFDKCKKCLLTFPKILSADSFLCSLPVLLSVILFWGLQDPTQSMFWTRGQEEFPVALPCFCCLDTVGQVNIFTLLEVCYWQNYLMKIKEKHLEKRETKAGYTRRMLFTNFFFRNICSVFHWLVCRRAGNNQLDAVLDGRVRVIAFPFF